MLRLTIVFSSPLHRAHDIAQDIASRLSPLNVPVAPADGPAQGWGTS